jgi:hypothetical protein
MKPGYLASPIAPDGIKIQKKVIKYERSETQFVVIVILCVNPEKTMPSRIQGIGSLAFCKCANPVKYFE